MRKLVQEAVAMIVGLFVVLDMMFLIDGIHDIAHADQVVRQVQKEPIGEIMTRVPTSIGQGVLTCTDVDGDPAKMDCTYDYVVLDQQGVGTIRLRKTLRKVASAGVLNKMEDFMSSWRAEVETFLAARR